MENVPIISDQNNNFQENYCKRLTTIFPKTVLLTIKKSKTHYYLDKINTYKDNTDLKEICGFDIMDESCNFDDQNEMSSENAIVILSDSNITFERNEAMPRNTSTRTVPNILRETSKMYTCSKTSLQQRTNIVQNNNSISNTFDSSFALDMRGTYNQEQKVSKKSSHKRKQVYNLMNIRQESPDWDINTSSKTNACLEHNTKTESNKNILQDKDDNDNFRHNESFISLTSEIVSSDSTSESISSLFLQDSEQSFHQDSVDFSSNDIFSQFNYESYNMNSANYLGVYGLNTYDPHGHINSEIYNEIYDTRYDTNSSACYRTQNLNVTECIELQETTFKPKFSIKEENLNDVMFLTDTNCCPKQCASNSSTDSSLETFSLNNQFDSGNELPSINAKDTIMKFGKVCSEFCGNNSSIPLTENTQSDFMDEEENYDKLIQKRNINPIDEETFLNNIPKSTKSSLLHLSNSEIESEYEIKKSEEFFHCIAEPNFETVAQTEIQQQMKSDRTTDTVLLKTEKKRKNTKNNKKLQCLLCSLTFTSARTMALHQAGAHGGMYIILCERCGRLFNQKYLFNRHIVHCGRFTNFFKCDICLKNYRHKSSLVQHLKTVHHVEYMHAHTKTFTCDKCSKIYSKFGAFEKHVNRHQDT